jgi:hypothetical protein
MKYAELFDYLRIKGAEIIPEEFVMYYNSARAKFLKETMDLIKEYTSTITLLPYSSVIAVEEMKTSDGYIIAPIYGPNPTQNDIDKQYDFLPTYMYCDTRVKFKFFDSSLTELAASTIIYMRYVSLGTDLTLATLTSNSELSGEYDLCIAYKILYDVFSLRQDGESIKKSVFYDNKWKEELRDIKRNKRTRKFLGGFVQPN